MQEENEGEEGDEGEGLLCDESGIREVGGTIYILFLLHVQENMNRQEAEGEELIEMRNIQVRGSRESEASYKLIKAFFSHHVFLSDGGDSPG